MEPSSRNHAARPGRPTLVLTHSSHSAKSSFDRAAPSDGSSQGSSRNYGRGAYSANTSPLTRTFELDQQPIVPPRGHSVTASGTLSPPRSPLDSSATSWPRPRSRASSAARSPSLQQHPLPPPPPGGYPRSGSFAGVGAFDNSYRHRSHSSAVNLDTASVSPTTASFGNHTGPRSSDGLALDLQSQSSSRGRNRGASVSSVQTSSSSTSGRRENQRSTAGTSRSAVPEPPIRRGSRPDLRTTQSHDHASRSELGLHLREGAMAGSDQASSLSQESSSISGGKQSRPGTTSSSSSAKGARPVVPKRHSSQRLHTSISSSSAVSPPPTPSRPLMFQEQPSAKSESVSDSSDYGSDADADEETWRQSMPTAVVADHPGDESTASVLEGGSFDAMQLTTGPPKLQRPVRTRGSLSAERDVASIAPSVASPASQEASLAKSPPSIPATSNALSPRKPRMEPSLERQRSITRLRNSMDQSDKSFAAAKSVLDDSSSTDTTQRTETTGPPKEQDEAALEAAALRTADEEDPNRPKTLKEAREMAKARALARRQAPGTESFSPPSVQTGFPSSIPQTMSSDKRHGQVPASISTNAIAADADPSQSRPPFPTTPSSTMEELQAAVGVALQDLNFQNSSEGDYSFESAGSRSDDVADLSLHTIKDRNAERLQPSHANGKSSPTASDSVSGAETEASGRSSADMSWNSAQEEPLYEHRGDEFDPSHDAEGRELQDEPVGSSSRHDGDITPSASFGLQLHKSNAVQSIGGHSDHQHDSLEGTPVQQPVRRGTLPSLQRLPSAAEAATMQSTQQRASIGHSNPVTPVSVPTSMTSAKPSDGSQSTETETGISEAHQQPASVQKAPKMTAATRIPVPGQTVPWPGALRTSSVAVEKKRLAPWERARAYAELTNELAAVPRGLDLWVYSMSNPTVAATKRKTSESHGRFGTLGGGARLPSSLSEAFPRGQNVNGGHEPHLRDVSGASARSDQTFPMRGDGGRARDVTQMPIDASRPGDMPDAVPANIPYPTLARPTHPGATRAESQATTSSASSKEYGYSAPLKAASSKNTNNTAAGTSHGRNVGQSTSPDPIHDALPASASNASLQQQNKPGFFSALGRRNSKRGPHPGAPAPLSSSSSTTNLSHSLQSATGSVSGPRAPRLAGVAAGAFSKVRGVGSVVSSPAQVTRSATVAAPPDGSRRSESSPLRGGPTSTAIFTDSLSSQQSAGSSSSTMVGGPRGPRLQSLNSSPSVATVNGSSGQQPRAGAPAGPADRTAAYPSPVAPTRQGSMAALRLSGSSAGHGSASSVSDRTAQHNGVSQNSQGGSGGEDSGGGFLSTFRAGSRKGSWTSGQSGGSPRLEDRPEFRETMRKLADILPDADEDVLAGYLRRASGNDLRAIGDYLGDQATGNIKAPGRRA